MFGFSSINNLCGLSSFRRVRRGGRYKGQHLSRKERYISKFPRRFRVMAQAAYERSYGLSGTYTHGGNVYSQGGTITAVKENGQWQDPSPGGGRIPPRGPTIVLEDPRNVAAGRTLFAGNQAIDRLLQSRGRSMVVQGGVAMPSRFTDAAQVQNMQWQQPIQPVRYQPGSAPSVTIAKPGPSLIRSTATSNYASASRPFFADPKNRWESCMNLQYRGAMILCPDSWKSQALTTTTPTTASAPAPLPTSIGYPKPLPIISASTAPAPIQATAQIQDAEPVKNQTKPYKPAIDAQNEIEPLLEVASPSFSIASRPVVKPVATKPDKPVKVMTSSQQPAPESSNAGAWVLAGIIALKAML